MDTRDPDRRGFTLLELLVVVAIIALLVAVLLPNLARARRQTKRSVCASNLHQLGLAISHYHADNRDWMPSDGELGEVSMVWEYGGQTGEQYGYNAPADRRPMNKYLGPEYYRCPDDRALDGYPYQTFYRGRGTSYPLNGYNRGFEPWEPFKWLGIVNRKTTDITNLKCLVAGDAVMDEYWGDETYWGPNYGYGFRWHDPMKPKANVLFADASATYLLMTRNDLESHLFWWEGTRFSFNPTARNQRDYEWLPPP